MSFTTMLVIEDDAVRNCLCSAFEGGSTYWIGSISYGSDDGSPCPKLAPGCTETDLPRYMIAPFTPGHWVEIVPDDASEEHPPRRLDRAAIGGALMLMATKFPKHFADLFEGNDDANTADLLLQLCVFGEEVYA
jgi:hypothetical protein